jgi:SAM-dependent methyltransferase
VTTSAPSRPALHARSTTYAGLFLITLSTLMYEIALTRVFSVTMWYHFAFVAISLALFGLTVGALLVYLLPQRFRDARVRTHLWLFSLLFSVSLALCFVTQLTIPFVPEPNLTGAWSVALTCIVISIPFVLSGVVVCLALTRFPGQVNRLYATDLVGAALGCVLLVVLFAFLDGPSLVIGIGAFAAVGSLLFALDAGSRRGTAWAIAAIVGLGGFAAVNGVLHDRGHPLLRIIWAKEEADPAHAYEKWNAYSRVTVDDVRGAPARPTGVGLSSALPDDTLVDERLLVIDSAASSVLTRYDGDPRTTDFLRYDVSNLAHSIRHDADVLVIGVGGGRDILSALEFDQRSVTGVEINRNILDATNGDFGDFTGHLDREPRVRFVNDEARSYLTRTDTKYDVIQISLIDTWAASSAGAYALSENSLYTTEAWETFLDRLQPGGILSVSRWYDVPGRAKPLEAYRATALAAQVLTDRGVADPREHMLLYRAPDNGAGASAVTLLVSPEPFSAEDRATLRQVTERLGFTPVLTAGEAPDERFAALTAPGGPGDAVADFAEDISPPTDNRPFFFQMASLGTLFGSAGFSSDDSTRPVLVLGLLAATVLGLALGFIVLPLLLKTDRAAHRGMSPFYTYFAGIGLGFLLVEIAQLQRLTVFLGHPTYALTVVLFSLLVFSGIGSIASERLADPGRPRLTLVPLGALLVTVAALGFLTPAVIDAMDAATTPARILTAVAILAPLGLLMGMPFAIGMRAASTRPAAPKAFLWGINGATSVCASVLGVTIAVFYGISASYWTGLVAYAVAGASLLVIVRGRSVPQQVPETEISEPAQAEEVPAAV